MKAVTTDRELLDRLRRRHDHLRERIDNPSRSENSKHWDRSEHSALEWAIRVCEQAMVDWPDWMKAIRDK